MATIEEVRNIEVIVLYLYNLLNSLLLLTFPSMTLLRNDFPSPQFLSYSMTIFAITIELPFDSTTSSNFYITFFTVAPMEDQQSMDDQEGMQEKLITSGTKTRIHLCL
jgi:hypothetical protein